MNSRFQNILDELATMPITIYPEPTPEEEKEDAETPTITLILYESPQEK
jgi:hypothetical protein